MLPATGRIDSTGGDVLVAQSVLDSPNVFGDVVQQGAAGVAEGVTGYPLSFKAGFYQVTVNYAIESDTGNPAPGSAIFTNTDEHGRD